MSKDKISAQDIIDSLAAKTDITKHLADDFFKSFISEIEEALQANDSVKIKDLGTFKLNWIAPRKSVNIQTGEDILIDGYYKVVFTPEKKLRELVNQPFAHMEPVILDDEVPEKESGSENEADTNLLVSLTEQADEIKGLLSEIQSMPTDKEEELKKEELKEEEFKEEEIEKPIEENYIINLEEKEETVEEEKENPVVINVDELIVNNSEKKRRRWPWVLLLILLLLGIAAALYFFYMPVHNWANKTFCGHGTEVCDSTATGENTDVDDEDNFFGQNEEIEAGDFQKAFDSRFESYENYTTEKLGYGSRLARLAKNHYGSPYFWVYIYEANIDVIPNPNQIETGTTVKVPKLNPDLIDLNNPQTLEKAWELEKKYVAKSK